MHIYFVAIIPIYQISSPGNASLGIMNHYFHIPSFYHQKGEIVCSLNVKFLHPLPSWIMSHMLQDVIIFIIIHPPPCIIIMAIDSIINICALIVDINCDKSSTSQALKMIYLQMRCLDGDEDTIHAKFALRWKSDSQFFVLWVIPFALWFITDLLLIW